jgi:hypothetical protein
MAKCLRRQAFLVPWAHRQPPNVAPVPTLRMTNVPMAQFVHLTALMARGMYSIGNRFQVTYTVNPLHNDSNIFGCACSGGCRVQGVLQSKQQSLESSKSYLCVELYFVIRRHSMSFPETPVKPGW